MDLSWGHNLTIDYNFFVYDLNAWAKQNKDDTEKELDPDAFFIYSKSSMTFWPSVIFPKEFCNFQRWLFREWNYLQ